MELLKELDACCSHKWVLRTLGTSKENSKLRELYSLIHAGVLTEADMAATIYGAGTPANHPPYRTLKTRLKEVYLNTICLGEHKVPSYKTYDEAYRNGYRLLGIVRLLMNKYRMLIARKVAEHTFLQIRSFEIIPLNQAFTDLLAFLYLGNSFIEKKYREYEQLSNYYSKAAFALSTVTRYYRDIRRLIYADKVPPLEIGLKAGEYTDMSLEIQKQYPMAPQIQAMFISIKISGLALRGEYRKAIEASIQGDQILDRVKGVSNSVWNSLAIAKIECGIKARDFELGKKQLHDANIQCISSPINNLGLKKYSILLGLITKQFDFAYKNFSTVNHLTIKRVAPIAEAQSWLVLEAYLNFLIQTNELILQDDWPKLRRFRVGSFLNSVNEITQNKSGANIQILMIRFLFSLLQKKYDLLIDQAEGLKTYSRRHLKGPENIRNRSFFKLMDLVVRTNFNRLAALKKSKVAIKKLQESNGKPGLNETELVPYEELWRIILKQLDVHKRDERELQQLLGASE